MCSIKIVGIIWIAIGLITGFGYFYNKDLATAFATGATVVGIGITLLSIDNKKGK